MVNTSWRDLVGWQELRRLRVETGRDANWLVSSFRSCIARHHTHVHAFHRSVFSDGEMTKVCLSPFTGLDVFTELRYRNGMTAVTSKTAADTGEWIIQRCINAFKNQYQDWPGYCERLLKRDEMLVALKECNQLWPDHEFRGHKVIDAHRSDVAARPPTSDEIAGMQWWNSMIEVERARALKAAGWKSGSTWTPSAADAWAHYKKP